MELLMRGLYAFSLLLGVLLRSPSAASAGTPPEWRSLVGPANDVAAAVAAGKPRLVVMNAMQALDNAQHALPPDVPRPISCWDMMTAAITASSLSGYDAQQARAALACYQGKIDAGNPVAPPSNAAADAKERQQSADFYGKVHPSGDSGADYNWKIYIPPAGAHRTVPQGNPCANSYLPGCSSGFQH